MLISILLAVVSPYTALIPAIYMTYKVLFQKVTIYKNPWNTGLFLLFVWSLIVGLLNDSFMSTLLSLAILIYFCLSVFLQNYFYNEDKIETLLKHLVHFSIFTAILGIVEKIVFAYFNVPLWEAFLEVTSGTNLSGRIYSTFGNPNVAGNWFSIMILVCIYLISTESKNKLLYKSSIVIFGIALLLTGSRGADIGLLIGLSTYYILKKNTKDIRYLVTFFIVIAIIAFLPSQIVKISNLMGHGLESSYSSRSAIWYGCLEMFTIKPLSGWGLTGIHDKAIYFINYNTIVFHGHNIWITIVTSFGLVGLSIYAYMKYSLFQSLKMLYNRNCRLVPLLAAVQGLIIGHGFVDFTMMAPQAGLLFICCSALISSLDMQYSGSYARSALPALRYNSLSHLGNHF
jgi:putative inorganic carbon (hco3(-)) transporter